MSVDCPQGCFLSFLHWLLRSMHWPCVGLFHPVKIIHPLVQNFAVEKVFNSWGWLFPCQMSLSGHVFLYKSNRRVDLPSIYLSKNVLVAYKGIVPSSCVLAGRNLCVAPAQLLPGQLGLLQCNVSAGGESIFIAYGPGELGLASALEFLQGIDQVI